MLQYCPPLKLRTVFVLAHAHFVYALVHCTAELLLFSCSSLYYKDFIYYSLYLYMCKYNNQAVTLETKNFTAFITLNHSMYKAILHHVFPPFDNNYHLDLILLELTRLS